MAERYLKVVEKVFNKGLVYLKLGGIFYKIKSVKMSGLDAKFECKNMVNGEDYEIKFKIKEELFAGLVRFGLGNKKDGVFIISEDSPDSMWLETSLSKLLRELEKIGLKEEIRKELSKYSDMEES